MYSQCPECLTRFRVTAAALRAAHGTVRCGRCGIAFDALQRLTDTVPEDDAEVAPAATLAAPLAPAASTEPAGPAAAEDPEFHFSADDIEQVFVDARDWTRRFPTEERERDTDRGPREPAGAASTVVYVHEPETIEDITLEGERIVIEGLPELDDDLREIVRAAEPVDAEAGVVVHEGADAVPLPEPEPEPPIDLDATDRYEVLRDAPEAADPALAEASVRIASDPAAVAGPTTTPEPAGGAPIVPFRLRQRESFDDALVAGVADDADVPPRRGRAMWALGAFVLALVLLAQVAHHYRHALARDGRVGPVLREAYARAGRPLPPHWDLGAYKIRQWGPDSAAVATGGAMTVRASLRNDAPFAQPLPLLRLELEDRFGNTVARRDFEPREWLEDSARAGRLLASGGTVEATLDVVDTGGDAVGYRLDLCMRTDAGVLQCAQMPAAGAQARQ